MKRMTSTGPFHPWNLYEFIANALHVDGVQPFVISCWGEIILSLS